MKVDKLNRQNLKRWYDVQPIWQKWVVGLNFVFLGVLCVAVFVAHNVFFLFGSSPSIGSVMSPKVALASEIYSEDGVLLGRLFDENRKWMPYDRVAPIFYETLVATEDERFYRHNGVDGVGLFSAMKDAAQGRLRGASTITQQLVKNLFKMRVNYSNGVLGKTRYGKLVAMKCKEMLLSRELEVLYSKQDILEMYVNTVDFGRNNYGIYAASRYYFNTVPDSMDVNQSAILVALLKATTEYNPELNPDKSVERRNVILGKLLAAEVIDRKEYDECVNAPLGLHICREKKREELTPYFNKQVYDVVMEKVPNVNLYTDGLKIYTSLDWKMQKEGERAVKEKMKEVQRVFLAEWGGRSPLGKKENDYIRRCMQTEKKYRYLKEKYKSNKDSIAYYLSLPHKMRLFAYGGDKEVVMSTWDSLRYMKNFMHAGLLSMEPQNGHVKVWVGDVDYKSWPFDKVLAMRQPGSLFKLFVFATALNQGLVPSDLRRDGFSLIDEEKEDSEVWHPTNANGKYSGKYVTLRQAFTQSLNTVAANLGQEVGLDDVILMARKMGVKSKMEKLPSLSLGACETTLYDMVGAYAVIANKGKYVEPVLVLRVEDSEGEVLYSAEGGGIDVLSENVAFYMQQLLQGAVIDPGATCGRMVKYVQPYFGKQQISVGGKTGTSNNHADGWFVGVTPNLVTGSWVGGEELAIRLRSGNGQGARTALPIVGRYMQRLLTHESMRRKYLKCFERTRKGLDTSTYKTEVVDLRREKEETKIMRISESDSINMLLKKEY